MGKGSSKLNCWEFKKCGRQPEGPNVRGLGTCPACTEERLDGTHGGANAGRACWVVSETLCDGIVQGDFVKKFQNCQKCDFYLQVKKEEHSNFTYSATLLEMLADYG